MKLNVGAVVVAVAFLLQHFCFVFAEEIVEIRNSTVESQNNNKNNTEIKKQELLPNELLELNKSDAVSVEQATEQQNIPSTPVAQLPVEDTTDKLISETDADTLQIAPDKIEQSAIEMKPVEAVEFVQSPVEDDEGPIILRPTEIPTVAPIFVPAPEPIPVSCPVCGQTQLWHRPQPCPHCSVCGHAMNPESWRSDSQRFARLENIPIRFHLPNDNDQLETQIVPQNENQNSGDAKLPLLPGALDQPKPPQRYMLIHADVNLNRKELLRRRLNYQKVREYRKAIGDTSEERIPEQPVPVLIPTSEEQINQQSQQSTDESSDTSFLSRTFSWLFGTNNEETTKESHPKESRAPNFHSLNGYYQHQQPKSFKCPFARN